MSDKFLERIKSKLTTETLKKCDKIDCRCFSKLAKDDLDNLRIERHNVRFEAAEAELQARATLLEEEVRELSEIGNIFDKELARLEKINTHLGSPVTDKLKAEATLRNYLKLIESETAKFPEVIDVTAMIEIQKNNEKMSADIAKLEKFTVQFAGLQPNISKARDAVERLAEEVDLLKTREAQKIDEDVATFIAKGSSFKIEHD